MAKKIADIVLAEFKAIPKRSKPTWIEQLKKSDPEMFEIIIAIKEAKKKKQLPQSNSQIADELLARYKKRITIAASTLSNFLEK